MLDRGLLGCSSLGPSLLSQARSLGKWRSTEQPGVVGLRRWPLLRRRLDLGRLRLAIGRPPSWGTLRIPLRDSAHFSIFPELFDTVIVCCKGDPPEGARCVLAGHPSRPQKVPCRLGGSDFCCSLFRQSVDESVCAPVRGSDFLPIGPPPLANGLDSLVRFTTMHLGFTPCMTHLCQHEDGPGTFHSILYHVIAFL